MSAPSSDTAAIRQIIRGLNSAGHTLKSVDDGGDDEIPVTGEQEAIDALTAVDCSTLYVTLPDGREGWILFVLGNSPEEVAANYTTNLETVIDPITDAWW